MTGPTITMTKPQLHFAHANSYPAGTYRRFFELLGRDFDIQALDMHAHNPNYCLLYTSPSPRD